MRAQVFISSGQAFADEKNVAENLQAIVRDLGFEPYFALAEQTSQALLFSILDHLQTSDYFLFVDFRRDNDASGQHWSRSVFTHQELAIASLLKIPMIAFQQLPAHRAGMLGAMQGNAIPFELMTELPNLARAELRKKLEAGEWTTNTRHRLSVERHVEDDTSNPDGSTWFHLRIRNDDAFRTARNCSAYLHHIRRNGDEIRTDESMRHLEFYWEGTLSPAVSLLPSLSRTCDVFFCNARNACASFDWRQATNSHTLKLPPLSEPGSYELDLIIIADNFPSCKATLVLTLFEGARCPTLELASPPELLGTDMKRMSPLGEQPDSR